MGALVPEVFEDLVLLNNGHLGFAINYVGETKR